MVLSVHALAACEQTWYKLIVEPTIYMSFAERSKRLSKLSNYGDSQFVKSPPISVHIKGLDDGDRLSNEIPISEAISTLLKPFCVPEVLLCLIPHFNEISSSSNITDEDTTTTSEDGHYDADEAASTSSSSSSESKRGMQTLKGSARILGSQWVVNVSATDDATGTLHVTISKSVDIEVLQKSADSIKSQKFPTQKAVIRTVMPIIIKRLLSFYSTGLAELRNGGHRNDDGLNSSSDSNVDQAEGIDEQGSVHPVCCPLCLAAAFGDVECVKALTSLSLGALNDSALAQRCSQLLCNSYLHQDSVGTPAPKCLMLAGLPPSTKTVFRLSPFIPFPSFVAGSDNSSYIGQYEDFSLISDPFFNSIVTAGVSSALRCAIWNAQPSSMGEGVTPDYEQTMAVLLKATWELELMNDMLIDGHSDVRAHLFSLVDTLDDDGVSKSAKQRANEVLTRISKKLIHSVLQTQLPLLIVQTSAMASAQVKSISVSGDMSNEVDEEDIIFNAATARNKDSLNNPIIMLKQAIGAALLSRSDRMADDSFLYWLCNEMLSATQEAKLKIEGFVRSEICDFSPLRNEKNRPLDHKSSGKWKKLVLNRVLDVLPTSNVIAIEFANFCMSEMVSFSLPHTSMKVLGAEYTIEFNKMSSYSGTYLHYLIHHKLHRLIEQILEWSRTENKLWQKSYLVDIYDCMIVTPLGLALMLGDDITQAHLLLTDQEVVVSSLCKPFLSWVGTESKTLTTPVLVTPLEFIHQLVLLDATGQLQADTQKENETICTFVAPTPLHAACIDAFDPSWASMYKRHCEILGSTETLPNNVVPPTIITSHPSWKACVALHNSALATPTESPTFVSITERLWNWHKMHRNASGDEVDGEKQSPILPGCIFNPQLALSDIIVDKLSLCREQGGDDELEQNYSLLIGVAQNDKWATGFEPNISTELNFLPGERIWSTIATAILCLASKNLVGDQNVETKYDPLPHALLRDLLLNGKMSTSQLSALASKLARMLKDVEERLRKKTEIQEAESHASSSDINSNVNQLDSGEPSPFPIYNATPPIPTPIDLSSSRRPLTIASAKTNRSRIASTSSLNQDRSGADFADAALQSRQTVQKSSIYLDLLRRERGERRRNASLDTERKLRMLESRRRAPSARNARLNGSTTFIENSNFQDSNTADSAQNNLSPEPELQQVDVEIEKELALVEKLDETIATIWHSPTCPIAIDTESSQVLVYLSDLRLWLVVPPPPSLALEVLEFEIANQRKASPLKTQEILPSGRKSDDTEKVLNKHVGDALHAITSRQIPDSQLEHVVAAATLTNANEPPLDEDSGSSVEDKSRIFASEIIEAFFHPTFTFDSTSSNWSPSFTDIIGWLSKVREGYLATLSFGMPFVDSFGHFQYRPALPAEEIPTARTKGRMPIGDVIRRTQPGNQGPYSETLLEGSIIHFRLVDSPNATSSDGTASNVYDKCFLDHVHLSDSETEYDEENLYNVAALESFTEGSKVVQTKVDQPEKAALPRVYFESRKSTSGPVVLFHLQEKKRETVSNINHHITSAKLRLPDPFVSPLPRHRFSSFHSEFVVLASTLQSVYFSDLGEGNDPDALYLSFESIPSGIFAGNETYQVSYDHLRVPRCGAEGQVASIDSPHPVPFKDRKRSYLGWFKLLDN